MTHDEHQRERMRAWIHVAAHTDTDNADYMLAAFDKRFPAPAAVEPEPRITIEWPACGDAELAALREKARLFDKLCEELPPGWKQNLRYWDAVASGKVRLSTCIGLPPVWWADYGTEPGRYMVSTRNFPTAAEAVQAAIDAGALK